MISLPLCLAILTITIVKMKLFDIFEFYTIISKLDFFTFNNSSTSRAKLFFTMIANSKFQKLWLSALYTKMFSALWTQIHVETRKKSSETVCFLDNLWDWFRDCWMNDCYEGFLFVLWIIIKYSLYLCKLFW